EATDVFGCIFVRIFDLMYMLSKKTYLTSFRPHDDALVCCVENTVEGLIMDSGALFHATYCKEELERIKLHSSKLLLLDEEGYHVGFGDQQLKVIKGSLVVARGNKCGSLYMVEVNPEGIDAIINDRLRIPAEKWRGKDTSLTHLKVFGCDSFVKVKDVCRESMKCIFIGNGSDEVRYSFRDTKSQQVIRSRDITFVDSIYGARYATNSSSLTKPIQKSQVVLVDIPENLAENDRIVAEHGLSSEITQSPGIRVRGPKTVGASRIVEDQMKNTLKTEHPPIREAPRLYRYEDPPESPGLRKDYQQGRMHHKACGCSWLKKSMMAAKAQKRGFSASWAGRKPRVQIEGNSVRTDSSTEATMKDRCSKKQVLGYVLTVGVTTVEYSWNEEPCRDVHQVGDEREVEVLRSFNWPPSELITEDGVLPERGYSQFNDVSSGYLDTLYRKSPSPAFGWCSVFRMFGGTESLARVVQLARSCSWCDHAVWHEPEQFSSELNNISLELYTVQRSVQRCVQLAVVVLVAALAPEFVLGFDPLKSGLSQLDIQSAPLGLQLVSAQVHVESVVVQLESSLVHLDSALVHLAIQTI
ncbi:retrovirus-related pol polyprotein from transposon TNT 1-94, partial [Tanacetum coccineum]